MKHNEPSPTVNMAAMLEVPVKASDETDTTKTGSTPPSSSDTTASSSSTLNDEHDPHYDDAILRQLARQLEYYFSKANLEKDTYVETLRQLNDGCVPVSILQRFSKVQALTPLETMDAILKAVSVHSTLLEVVPVDTKTGKRVVEKEDVDASSNLQDQNTILAIGSKSGEPLDNTALESVTAAAAYRPNTPGTPIQNTIIIREVDPRVTEAEVRALFDEEHCPPIQSLYLDVFHCWFVTLDTTSRDDMLYVMMQLRCQYLGDEPVKARLKSLARQLDPASAPPLPVLTPVLSYGHLPGAVHQQAMVMPPSNGGKKNRKQKKRANKNNNKGNGNNNNNSSGSQGKKTGNSQQQGNRDSKKQEDSRKKKNAQPKPDLSSASFPSLTSSTTSDTGRKVEVVVGDKIVASPAKVAGSDAASTATTSSFSSSEGKGKQQQLGGYAAALLKANTSPKVGVKAKEPQSKANVQKVSDKEDKASSPVVEKAVPSVSEKAEASSDAATMKSASVSAKPSAWGGGRSFADVLAR